MLSAGTFLLAACSGSSGGSVASPVGGPVVSVPGKCGGQAVSIATVSIANSGRKLAPLGAMTTVGNFPTGGRLSPDGGYYWSVSAGHGQNDVHIVRVADGSVVQVLPLPGSYGQMTFAPGTGPQSYRAYVSGTPKGSSTPNGPTVGDSGDVIHVFDFNAITGHATELAPMTLPSTTGGSGRTNSFSVPPNNTTLPNGPAGLAVTPDGKKLVVALYNADKVAVIDTRNPTASSSAPTVAVGKYPFAVGFDRGGKNVYVSNAYDGTLSTFDATSASSSTTATTISGLGGPDGDQNSQPQYVLADPSQDLLYVAVTNHDGVAVIDTKAGSIKKFISVRRSEGYGSQPVALALAPDHSTLYVANAGENAVVAIALTDRADGSFKQYDVIGKIPVADYATDVQLTPDGCTLVWQAGRGAGSGANPLYSSTHGYPAVNNDGGPYPSYIPDMLIGRVGIVPLPTDSSFAQLTAVVDAAQRPENAQSPPLDTPLTNATGGASDKIEYVFYVVKENRTYDQLYGSDPRGNGDPALEVLEDNCKNNPSYTGSPTFFGCGTTPNQHALSRMFVLLDNFYEDSEVSTDGHAITTGAYATNYSLKSMHQDYSNRGRPSNEVGVFPVTFPPKHFLFDQAVTQSITFRNYGELSGGASPNFSDDGRLTYQQVEANSDTSNYPNNVFNGCVNNQNAPDSPQCAFDCGMNCNQISPRNPPKSLSRIDAFNKTFTAQIASCNDTTIAAGTCQVPHFNYMIMMSDHTNGVGDGARDPLSMVADNDLGVGQLVQILSGSPIWKYTAIFVVEDDSQDGADHVDAHRAPVLVVGPYVKHGGAVIHTHYDQVSVIHTIELILGMQPLSVFDAVATPMYDAFTSTPDFTTYTAKQPDYSLFSVCNSDKRAPAYHPCVTGNAATASAADLQLAEANAKLSAALPFNQLDRVPQAINDRLLWQRVFGLSRPVPQPGPHGSRLEHAKAMQALAVWERYRRFPPLARERLKELLSQDDD